MAIEYRNDQRPSTAEIKRLYESAGLLDAPVKDEDRMRRMFEGSNVVWTAWERVGSEVRLVGILRGWTEHTMGTSAILQLTAAARNRE